MKSIKHILHFVQLNKKYLAVIILPSIALVVFLAVINKTPNTPIYLPNTAPEQQIKKLTQELNQLNEQLAQKQHKDSVLQVQSKKEIAELRALIKTIKTENEKKRLLLNTADIDESYNILTNNIKKRSK